MLLPPLLVQQPSLLTHPRIVHRTLPPSEPGLVDVGRRLDDVAGDTDADLVAGFRELCRRTPAGAEVLDATAPAARADSERGAVLGIDFPPRRFEPRGHRSRRHDDSPRRDGLGNSRARLCRQGTCTGRRSQDGPGTGGFRAASKQHSGIVTWRRVGIAPGFEYRVEYALL